MRAHCELIGVTFVFDLLVPFLVLERFIYDTRCYVVSEDLQIVCLIPYRVTF